MTQRTDFVVLVVLVDEVVVFVLLVVVLVVVVEVFAAKILVGNLIPLQSLGDLRELFSGITYWSSLTTWYYSLWSLWSLWSKMKKQKRQFHLVNKESPDQLLIRYWCNNTLKIRLFQQDPCQWL